MTTETKHTPGPWHVEALRGLPIMIRGANGIAVAMITRDFPRGRQDAPVLAAAPELLDLARHVAGALDASGTRWEGTAPGLEELGRRAALLVAKAEGRSNG